MASPGKNSTDIPLRVSKAGKAVIEDFASEEGIEQVEVVRRALTEYFGKRGQKVDFSPAAKGGVQTRQTEQDAVEQVLDRVKALGLPEPETEYKLSHKVYDLAWPAREVAIEVAKRKRPADSNGWSVGHIRPNMKQADIDKILNSLPIAG